MKATNANELNDKYKDCPSQTHEYFLDGKKYVVVSHFTGKKDLDDVVYKSAYNRAMAEVLNG